MNIINCFFICTFLFLLLAVAESSFAQGGRNTTPGSHYKEKHANKGANRYSSGSNGAVSNENTQAATDSISASKKNGSAAKAEFMKKSGFPMGRPGYVLSYIVPLDKGGCDCVSNMQWITIDEAIKQGLIE